MNFQNVFVVGIPTVSVHYVAYFSFLPIIIDSLVPQVDMSAANGSNGSNGINQLAVRHPTGREGFPSRGLDNAAFEVRRVKIVPPVCSPHCDWPLMRSYTWSELNGNLNQPVYQFGRLCE